MDRDKVIRGYHVGGLGRKEQEDLWGERDKTLYGAYICSKVPILLAIFYSICIFYWYPQNEHCHIPKCEMTYPLNCYSLNPSEVPSSTNLLIVLLKLFVTMMNKRERMGVSLYGPLKAPINAFEWSINQHPQACFWNAHVDIFFLFFLEGHFS